MREISARFQVDVQVAAEGIGDPQQGVDSRRPAAALEPRDRGLCRPDALGELPLGKPERGAPVGYLVGDPCEKPPFVCTGKPLPDPLDGTCPGIVVARSHLCDSIAPLR